MSIEDFMLYWMAGYCPKALPPVPDSAFSKVEVIPSRPTYKVRELPELMLLDGVQRSAFQAYKAAERDAERLNVRG